MAGAHHRTPQYRKTSALIAATARADPNARCWRCGRTIDEHPRHRSGRAATWQAGHVNPGELNGVVLAEVSTCNLDASNKTAEPHSRHW